MNLGLMVYTASVMLKKRVRINRNTLKMQTCLGLTANITLYTLNLNCAVGFMIEL